MVSIALAEARALTAMDMQLARVKFGLKAEVSLTNSDNTGALIVALLGENNEKKVILNLFTSIQ